MLFMCNNLYYCYRQHQHMEVNPVISEFSLDPHPPHQPPLIRSRLNQPAKPALSRLPLPNELLIQVRPPSQTQTPQNNGIRNDIDACLNAVEQAHIQRNKPQQIFIGKNSQAQQEAIHRIDSNIVMDYVSTIYRDYGIRNRFGPFDPNSVKRSAVTPRPETAKVNDRVRVDAVIKVEPLRQEVRAERVSWSRPSKQFLNVTQESIITKRDLSFYSQKPERIVFAGPPAQNLVFNQSPVSLPRASTSRMPQTSTKRSQLMGKAREDLRYCVNCEKAVLMLNADFHEQFECPQFEQLYTLSFKALAQLVWGKVQRMRQQLGGMISALRQDADNRNSRGGVIACNLVNLMEEYAKDEPTQAQNIKEEIREEQRRLKYNLFKQSLNNLYSEAVELTHKLHWFQQISIRLRQEQQKTHESTSKTEQGKAVQYIRMMSPIPTQKQAFVHFSPVNYLHPHLHRRRHH